MKEAPLPLFSTAWAWLIVIVPFSSASPAPQKGRHEYRLIITPNNGSVRQEYTLIKEAAATEAKLTKGGNPIANNELGATAPDRSKQSGRLPRR